MEKIIENGLNKSVLNMVSYDTVIMVLYQQQSDVSFQRSVPQHLDTGSLKTLPYGSDDMKICGTVENLRNTV